MRQNISPCKCGCDPLLFRVGDDKQYYLLRCPVCYMSTDDDDDANTTLESAIDKWNAKMRLEKSEELYG